jgi:hypothetical protein
MKGHLMKINEYLIRQFNNLNGVLHHIVGDINAEEWMSRPGPGQNTLGYSVWHIPRTQDHFFRMWILGQSEVMRNGQWSKWDHLKPLGIGIGITLEEADQIARDTNLVDTLAYADEVHRSILEWLAGIDESALDLVPSAKETLQPYPEYQTPGFHAETDDLLGLPVWGLLIRPCMGHIHRHLGEIEITKDVLRKSK